MSSACWERQYSSFALPVVPAPEKPVSVTALLTFFYSFPNLKKDQLFGEILRQRPI
jgi:hypothetical protein